MKAETLKKSILQYAMQGKLVAQDPNDEPASELLKRIKVEKEQLIKDGKIKKEKPLPPITADEIPYELPQGWEWVRLGDICKLSQGNRVKNVQLPLLNAKYLRFKLEKIIYTEGILVNNGDYLILVDGENSGEVFYAFEDGIMGSTFKLLDISNYVSLNFVLKILQFYQDIFRGSKKGAAIPHLDKTLFKNVVIGLPPIAEQQRIVEKLEEILPLVEEYGKNEEILSEMNKKLPKQIRQSIFQYAVQGKLVPQNPNDEPASELLKRIKAEKEQLIKDGKIKKEKPLPPITPDEIPFEIPKSWTWVYWNDLLSYEQYSMKRGPFGSALKKDFFVPKGIRVFEQYNAINDDPYWSRYYITKEKYEELKAFTAKAGDLLISCSGVTLGRITEIPDDADWGIINQALLKLKLNKKLISNNYFKMLFKSKYMQDLIFDKALGSAIPNMVGVVELKRIQIPLPPLAEQQRIVAKVEELMQIVDNLEC